MLRCFFIGRKLYDYLDNTLSEKEKIAVQEHLAVCPRCSRSLSEIGRVIRLVSEMPFPRPGEDFWHKFKSELDDKLNRRLGVFTRNKHTVPVSAKPVFAAMLIVFLFLAVSAFFRFSGKQESPKKSDLLLIKDIRALEEQAFDADPESQPTIYIDGLRLLSQQNQSS